jgi:serine kinase of HPr protein (carbohydrate metabolism regulator)
MSQAATEADPAPQLLHGTAVALGARAALIRGPSGSGKSDLALRCIALPAPFPRADASAPRFAELVSDDQVVCVARDGCVDVSPPASIAGKIEVRGLGIIAVPYRPLARLSLVVELVAAQDVPRFPLDSPTANIMGIQLPLVRLAPFEPSAPLKLLLALNSASNGAAGW